MSTQEILKQISIWIVVMPFITGFFIYRHLSKDSILIFWVVFASSVSQLLDLTPKCFESLKYTVYNLYTIVEFILLFILFEKYVYNETRNKIITALAIVYAPIAFYFFSTERIWEQFASQLVCINNLAYTAWIMFILYEQYSESAIAKLEMRSSLFWFITGLIFYAPCTTILFAFWQYIRSNEHDEQVNQLWIIHHLMNIGMYTLFTIGLSKDYKGKFGRIFSIKGKIA